MEGGLGRRLTGVFHPDRCAIVTLCHLGDLSGYLDHGGRRTTAQVDDVDSTFHNVAVQHCCEIVMQKRSGQEVAGCGWGRSEHDPLILHCHLHEFVGARDL